MMVRLFFKLPDNSIKVADLLESVSNSWKHMRGRVRATKRLQDTGRIVGGTGVRICGARDCRIVGARKDDGTISEPNIFSLLITSLLPEFVDFEVGLNEAENIQSVKAVAGGFVISGYEGSLLFGKSIPNEQEFESPYSAECSFELSPWVGQSDEECGDQPARMRLGWNEQNDGSREDIKTILWKCHRMGLKEYLPNTE